MLEKQDYFLKINEEGIKILKSKFTIFSLVVVLIFSIFSIVGMAKIYTIAADPLGSGTYGCTVGIAKISNEVGPYNIKVEPTTGATEIGPLLAFGEVELGIMRNWESEKCWKTDMHYDEPLKSLKVAPMRIIMGGPPTLVSPVVREDAGIKASADLRRKYI